jgi:hypothetical protein
VLQNNPLSKTVVKNMKMMQT